MKKYGILLCLLIGLYPFIGWGQDIEAGEQEVAFDREESEVTFDIDRSSGKFILNVWWEGLVSDVTLTLIDPEGKTYPLDDGLQLSLGVSVMANIEAAPPGRWRLRYKNNSAGKKKLKIRVKDSPYHAGSAPQISHHVLIKNVPMDLLDAEKESVARVRFVTRRGDRNLAKVKIEAVVRDPGGRTLVLHPRDDGIAPDDIADDGVYAADFYCRYSGGYRISSRVDNGDGLAVETWVGETAPKSNKGVPILFGDTVDENFQRASDAYFFVINGYNPKKLKYLLLNQFMLTFNNPGETYQLSVRDWGPADALNKEVSWISSDNTVFTVDENGLVTATGKGAGYVTVHSLDGAALAGCFVFVGADNFPARPRAWLPVPTTLSPAYNAQVVYENIPLVISPFQGGSEFYHVATRWVIFSKGEAFETIINAPLNVMNLQGGDLMNKGWETVEWYAMHRYKKYGDPAVYETRKSKTSRFEMVYPHNMPPQPNFNPKPNPDPSRYPEPEFGGKTENGLKEVFPMLGEVEGTGALLPGVEEEFRVAIYPPESADVKLIWSIIPADAQVVLLPDPQGRSNAIRVLAMENCGTSYLNVKISWDMTDEDKLNNGMSRSLPLYMGQSNMNVDKK